MDKMEDDENIRIPFLGDNEISNSTSPMQLAPWVEERDKIPLLLALSIYETTPRPRLGAFYIIASSKRVGVWFDPTTNTLVVGLKGTSSKSLDKDIDDDFIILSNPSYCNLTLVQEASQILDGVLTSITKPLMDPFGGMIAPARTDQTPNIIFAGHSLGGTATMCMTIKYPGSRGISFNGGASPTNPITAGPGEGRFTHYHIVGDLISSHMTDQAAKVIRIKIPGKEFGSQKPHSSGNLKVNGFPYTAQQEDLDYQKWGSRANIQYNIIKHVLAVTRFQTKLQTERVVENSPIPGSIRYMMK